MTNTLIMKSLRSKIQKKTPKNLLVTRKCDTLYRDGQTDIYLQRKSELVEAVACVKGTFFFICVGSVGAEMYLAELCICSRIRFHKRNLWNSGHLQLRKWCFTRTIDFTVDTSNQFLSSVHKAFTSENTFHSCICSWQKWEKFYDCANILRV
jgi:hypothetical protein